MQEYKQSTKFTGAASSLLMVVHHYKPDFALSKENEFRIWLSSVNLPTRACSIYGLARFALSLEIPTRLVVGNEEYDYPDYRFKGYKKEEIDAAKFSEDLHLKDIRDINAKITVKDFSLGDVKGLLSKNKIIILRLDAGVIRELRPSSSYVVVSGYNGRFEVYDPYQGKVFVSEERMEQSMTDLVIKRKRDHRMLVFG